MYQICRIKPEYYISFILINFFDSSTIAQQKPRLFFTKKLVESCLAECRWVEFGEMDYLAELTFWSIDHLTELTFSRMVNQPYEPFSRMSNIIFSRMLFGQMRHLTEPT